jgi:hypothetical protein
VVLSILWSIQGIQPSKFATDVATPHFGRGMFHTWQPDPALILDDRYRALIAAQVFRIAESTSDISAAIQWAERVVRLSREPIRETAIFTHPTLIDDRVRTGAYKEAIGFAREFVNVMTQDQQRPIDSEYLFILYGMLPVMLSIVGQSAIDRDAAKRCCIDLMIELQGENVEPGRKAAKAVAILEDALLRNVSGRDLLHNAHDAYGGDDGLRFAAYVSALACADVGPVEAISICLAFAPAIAKEFAGIKPLWRCYLRFLTTYWQNTFRRSRGLFAAPAVTEEDLEAAFTLPAGRRAQAILQVAADGLRVRIPEPIRAWIQSK